MDQVVAELLKYGLPGVGLLGLAWAYMQERADRKIAEVRLIEYLAKDRDAVLAVCQLATTAMGEAASAHRANKDYIGALAARLLDRGSPIHGPAE